MSNTSLKSMKKSKKTTAAKNKGKKKDLKELSQTHGKTGDSFQPTTLEQVWGDEGLGKYGTLSEEEYSKQLDEYNRTDLQSHAAKVGIVPLDDRTRLTKSLLAQFRAHASSYKKPSDPKSTGLKVSQAAAKILSEGR